MRKKIVRTISAGEVSATPQLTAVKKQLNRTVSASVGDKALSKSSSSFYVSKTLPVKTEVVGIDSKKQVVTPPSARVMRRGAKSSMNITPPKSVAGATVQLTPSGPANSVANPTTDSITFGNVFQRKSTSVPVFVDESSGLSALEKDLAKLQRNPINRTKSTNDIPAIQPIVVVKAKATERKRGLSTPQDYVPLGSNNSDLEPIRHLDLNWRNGGGKRPDDTIFKYFQVVPSPQKV